MKCKIIFFSLCIFLSSSSAQQLPFKTYTRGTGLASDYILSLFQDDRGFLWIGTDRGVSRYDGISFRNFTTEDGLSSNMIYYIFQSSDGAMWFGTYEGGVCRFDGKKFQTFTNKNGLPANSVNAITEDKFGRMYFQTSLGIVMKRGSTFINIFDYSNGTTRPMLPLRNGNLLIPDSSKLYEITPTDDDRISKKIVPIDSSLNINFYFMNSTAAIERADGEVVMAAAHNLLFLRKTKSGWRVNRKEGKLYEVTGLGEDVSKNLWLSGQFGLEKISNGRTTLFGIKTGVDPPFVQALLVDREGVIWVGTFGGGLKKLSGDYLRFFTTREGLLSDNVNTVFPDSKNRIWIGTKNLANVIQSDSVYHLHFDRQYSNDQARAFGESGDGALYLGGFNYIFKIHSLSGNNYKAIRLPKIKGAFSGISVINSSLKNNELWMGTYGEGVVHLVDGKTNRLTKNDGLVSDLIENISATKEGIWFLSRNNGATFYKNGKMKNFSAPNEFPSKMIYCVQEENNGKILFGTNKGLVQMRKKEIRIFGNSEGLVGTSVLGIIIDSSAGIDKIWILSDRALHRFENEKLLPYASFSLLPSEDASINQITYQSSTNQLWLATTKGAVRVKLNEARRIKIAPLIHIMKIFNDEGTLYDKLTTITTEKDLDHLALSYNDNNISFRYGSTSFTREEEVRYKYKLEGQDERWSELTRERIVRYRNLRDGDYTFSVIAINPDGVHSDKIASVSITIMPPFWRTWWLRLILGIVVLSIIIGIVRHFSTKELKRQIHELEKEKAVQKERERISRDLHDNVGSQLTNIISGIGLAEIYNKAEKPKADTLLHSLQDEARETMMQLRETIRALKSTEISFDNFIIELKNVIDRHAKYYSGDLHLVVEDHSLCEIILKPLEALNLFRIVQEAITNSIKHSEAKQITVTISCEVEILAIKIIDDGVGMKNEISDLVNGNGIENMKKRSDEIGAEIEFTSDKNKGVCVKVTLPIKRKF